MDKTKKKKLIKIFDNKFWIESDPILKNDEVIGWNVSVWMGEKDEVKNNSMETYEDYTPDRMYAEEACFGYFLIEYCGGGIYWVEYPEE